MNQQTWFANFARQLPGYRQISICFSLLILAISLIPDTARVFESSMINHMLIQLPLLAIVGAALVNFDGRIYRYGVSLDPHGFIALIAASGGLFFWMLPLNLDLATGDPIYRALKVVTVPLCVGVSLKWVWLRCHPIIKIVVVFEIWAAAARIGWLYLESPGQLCSNYLIGEQQIVGRVLLMLSAVTGVIGLFYIIFGSFRIFEKKDWRD